MKFDRPATALAVSSNHANRDRPGASKARMTTTRLPCQTRPMWLWFAVLALLAYLFAAWRAFDQAGDRARLGAAQLWPGLLAALMHALALGLYWRADGGVALTFPLAVSAIGLTLVDVFLLLSWTRQLLQMGTAIYPIAAFSLLVHTGLSLMPSAASAKPLTDWRILLHAGMALLAFSTLLMGALAAVMLSLQERALKARRFAAWMERVPPLTQVEALVFHLITAGFVLLTLALLTGALFVENLLAQHLAHKTVLSVLAWLVYGGLLLARWRLGIRGQRAARWVWVATVCLTLAFLGSKFVLEVVLQRS